METWIAIENYSGRYEVSDQGRVRRSADQVLMGQWKSQLGYWRVRLSGPRRIILVHRLVAEAFVPNPLNKPSINHLDHDRANNLPGNLEWCTQSENLAHMTAAGRRVGYWRGRRGPNANLSNEVVIAIRQDRITGATLAAIGLRHGVSKRTVHRIVRRESYTDV